MHFSHYLENAVFYEQSPATAQLFDEKSHQLFEASPEKCCVEIHVQQSHADQHTAETPSSPEPSSAHTEPPRYTGSRLLQIRVNDPKDRLSITRGLFDDLLRQFEIFPRFREFVLLFGAKHGENEIGPPHMRFRRLVPFGSSSRECAYGLRFVELNHRGTREPWSVRQTAIYHRYMLEGKASTWIMISPSVKIKASLNKYVSSSENLAALNPFEIHVILLDTALGNWRSYIIYLTEEVSKQTDRVLVASISDRDQLQLLDIGERQILKDFEDKVLDVLLALDSTIHTIRSLTEKYHQLCQDSSFFDNDCKHGEYDCIAVALQEKGQEVSLTRTKVETLHSKIQSTISLLSSLLDLGNSSALKVLAEEARMENAAMRALAEKSTNDAAAVKSFFSTEFAQLQSQEDGSSRIVVFGEAWLLAAIAVPLTMFTLILWWTWTRLQTPQRDRTSRTLGRVSFWEHLNKKRPKRHSPQGIDIE
ncbi:MAG: hypothetical protein Q9192_000912 [Flavoplaca navasiana]